MSSAALQIAVNRLKNFNTIHWHELAGECVRINQIATVGDVLWDRNRPWPCLVFNKMPRVEVD